MSRIVSILGLCLMLGANVALGQTSGDINGNSASQDNVLYIANAFSPNGDGVNDEFYVSGGDFNRFTFSAFDRWGNQVYTTNDPAFRWNGTSGNDPLPIGTYVFILEGITRRGDQVKRSGTISIMR